MQLNEFEVQVVKERLFIFSAVTHTILYQMKPKASCCKTCYSCNLSLLLNLLQL